MTELKNVGLRQHQVMDVMERYYGGYEATGFTTRDLYNFFVTQKKKRIEGGDADHVIKYMQARQMDDMEFFYRVREGRRWLSEKAFLGGCTIQN